MSKLYIVATPIGNLGDITFRAIETLKYADLILCEDTRVTKKILEYYNICKPLLSYHQRSQLSRTEKIIEHLKQGENLALVSDAGTPGLSDPGNELIEAVQKAIPEVEVISIPGPSALTALIQVAGIPLSKFLFLGFPPHKKGRETFFKQIIISEVPVIYYESPHRVIKNLDLLKGLSEDKNFNIIIGRELTKMFEQVVRGSLDDVIEYFNINSDKVRGEFVILVQAL